MSVTIKDIAKIAGVSHSTVSRSLNDNPMIAEETRNRIKKIAKEYGFEFNANARGLSSKKTGTIGLVYPEGFEDFNINLFFNTIQSYVRRTIEKEGYDVIVTFPRNRFTGESNIQKLINRKKVDGLIIVHWEMDNDDLIYLRDSGVPYVFLHRKPNLEILKQADFYCTDHFAGGYLAATHLAEAGRRNIATISILSEEFYQRTDGFKAGLKDRGIIFDPKYFFCGDISFESGYAAIKDNLAKINKIDAIFAQSDLMALGAIDALKSEGLKIPEDIAVVGYDDIELCTMFTPKLTTIHQPREEITVLACEKLMDMLKGGKRKKSENMVLQPTLIVRESCGCK